MISHQVVSWLSDCRRFLKARGIISHAESRAGWCRNWLAESEIVYSHPLFRRLAGNWSRLKRSAEGLSRRRFTAGLGLFIIYPYPPDKFF